MSRSNRFAGRRVLVTGHTGFKGAWLSLWLQRLGAEVMGYALAPPTTPSLFELTKLARRLDHVVGDVRDLDAVLAAFERHEPEVVFHLAAQPLVLQSYREPKETFDTNVGGTVNILEAVRRTSSVRAVVVVTSDKCYDNREWLFGYRENDAMGGHDPYSASKGAAELVTAAYRSSFFAPGAWTRVVGVASARAGNVIGGGDFADDRILPDALRAVQAGKPLLVRNPGSTRPWQHVLDPLAGYLLLATRLLEDPARYAEPFNFGPELSGVSSVRELVTSFYAALGDGRFVSPARRKAAPHEARLLRLSCDKARSQLGWQPGFDTATAVERTAVWYREVVLRGGDAAAACLRDIRAHEKAFTPLRSTPGARVVPLRKAARSR